MNRFYRQLWRFDHRDGLVLVFRCWIAFPHRSFPTSMTYSVGESRFWGRSPQSNPGVAG